MPWLILFLTHKTSNGDDSRHRSVSGKDCRAEKVVRDHRSRNHRGISDSTTQSVGLSGTWRQFETKKWHRIKTNAQIVLLCCFSTSQPNLSLLMQVLKGCKTLAMSVCSLGRLPSGCITNHAYSWVDPVGRSVSPPPDEQDIKQRKEATADVRMVRISLLFSEIVMIAVISVCWNHNCL